MADKKEKLGVVKTTLLILSAFFLFTCSESATTSGSSNSESPKAEHTREFVPSQKCDELKAVIDKTYGFKPSKLTREQITAKSSELDKVWEIVDKSPGELLGCLRNEIDQRKDDTFFRFNASNLLYKHDQSVETKKLMIETYSGADLADINPRYWLPYMAAFGFEGLDVTEVGKTWLRFPDPTYYLPQHGTRPVDKRVGSLAAFGSMDESIATPALAKLSTEEKGDIQSIAIWLLVNQATDESDREVRALIRTLPKSLADSVLRDVLQPRPIEPRAEKPQINREEFVTALSELAEGKPGKFADLTVKVSDGERDMVVVMTQEDLPLIRKARRYYASMATPHSPEWYKNFTDVINTIRSKSTYD